MARLVRAIQFFGETKRRPSCFDWLSMRVFLFLTLSLSKGVGVCAVHCTVRCIMVVDWKVCPGRNSVDGKFGLLGLSG